MKQAEESEVEKDLKTIKGLFQTIYAPAGETGGIHGQGMKHDGCRIIRPVFKLNSAEVERRARVGAWGANHEAERGRFNLEVRQFLQAAVCDFGAKAQSRSRTWPGRQGSQSAAVCLCKLRFGDAKDIKNTICCSQILSAYNVNVLINRCE